MTIDRQVRVDINSRISKIKEMLDGIESVFSRAQQKDKMDSAVKDELDAEISAIKDTLENMEQMLNSEFKSSF